MIYIAMLVGMVIMVDLLSVIYMLYVDNHLYCKFGYNGCRDRLAK